MRDVEQPAGVEPTSHDAEELRRVDEAAVAQGCVYADGGDLPIHQVHPRRPGLVERGASRGAAPL